MSNNVPEPPGRGRVNTRTSEGGRGRVPDPEGSPSVAVENSASSSSSELPDATEQLQDLSLGEDDNLVSGSPPPLVLLEDSCKFKDPEGNIIEVEMCGERCWDGLYVFTPDVATKLLGQSPNRTRDTLTHPNSQFIPEMHFRTLPRTEGKPMVYLTWLGLIAILFRSLQMGSEEEKADVISDMFGLPAVRNVMRRFSPANVTAVYLLTIGTIGNLRHTMNITNSNLADDVVIVKLDQHHSFFGGICGAAPQFERCVLIDDKDQVLACETYLGDFLPIRGGLSVTFDANAMLVLKKPGRVPRLATDHKEIVAISQSDLKLVTDQLDNMQQQ
ncbi:hypothetical protein HKX48_009106 [Thoreauomyces humboldtii]|nr:hypothetical protein HKX48_009106 [Thoreauomyces humboldtii]